MIIRNIVLFGKIKNGGWSFITIKNREFIFLKHIYKTSHTLHRPLQLPKERRTLTYQFYLLRDLSLHFLWYNWQEKINFSEMYFHLLQLSLQFCPGPNHHLKLFHNSPVKIANHQNRNDQISKSFPLQ